MKPPPLPVTIMNRGQLAVEIVNKYFSVLLPHTKGRGPFHVQGGRDAVSASLQLKQHHPWAALNTLSQKFIAMGRDEVTAKQAVSLQMLQHLEQQGILPDDWWRWPRNWDQGTEASAQRFLIIVHLLDQRERTWAARKNVINFRVHDVAMASQVLNDMIHEGLVVENTTNQVRLASIEEYNAIQHLPKQQRQPAVQLKPQPPPPQLQQHQPYDQPQHRADYFPQQQQPAPFQQQQQQPTYQQQQLPPQQGRAYREEPYQQQPVYQHQHRSSYQQQAQQQPLQPPGGYYDSRQQQQQQQQSRYDYPHNQQLPVGGESSANPPAWQQQQQQQWPPSNSTSWQQQGPPGQQQQPYSPRGYVQQPYSPRGQMQQQHPGYQQPISPRYSQQPIPPRYSQQPISPRYSQQPLSPRYSQQPLSPRYSQPPVAPAHMQPGPAYGQQQQWREDRLPAHRGWLADKGAVQRGWEDDRPPPVQRRRSGDPLTNRLPVLQRTRSDEPQPPMLQRARSTERQGPVLSGLQRSRPDERQLPVLQRARPEERQQVPERGWSGDRQPTLQQQGWVEGKEAMRRGWVEDKQPVQQLWVEDKQRQLPLRQLQQQQQPGGWRDREQQPQGLSVYGQPPRHPTHQLQHEQGTPHGLKRASSGSVSYGGARDWSDHHHASQRPRDDNQQYSQQYNQQYKRSRQDEGLRDRAEGSQGSRGGAVPLGREERSRSRDGAKGGGRGGGRDGGSRGGRDNAVRGSSRDERPHSKMEGSKGREERSRGSREQGSAQRGREKGSGKGGKGPSEGSAAAKGGREGGRGWHEGSKGSKQEGLSYADSRGEGAGGSGVLDQQLEPQVHRQQQQQQGPARHRNSAAAAAGGPAATTSAFAAAAGAAPGKPLAPQELCAAVTQLLAAVAPFALDVEKIKTHFAAAAAGDTLVPGSSIDGLLRRLEDEGLLETYVVDDRHISNARFARSVQNCWSEQVQALISSGTEGAAVAAVAGATGSAEVVN